VARRDRIVAAAWMHFQDVAFGVDRLSGKDGRSIDWVNI
jgi:hypothetical protein